MKHSKKVNPLTHFNNLKAEAVKKAGKDMSTYKKSLRKAQAGIQKNSSDPASMASSDVRTNISNMNPMGTNINEANRMYDKGSVNPNNVIREATERNRQVLNTPRDNQAAQARMSAVMSKTPRAIAEPVSKVDSSSYEQYKKQFNKKGGSVKKMSKGGSLKPVPGDKVGLSKLPTPVRNKMGYQKKGGSVKKMQMGGKVGVPKKSFTSDDRVNADGSKPKTVAPVSRPPVSKTPTKRPPVSKTPTVSSKSTKVGKVGKYVFDNPSSKKASSVSGKKIIKEKDGSVSINKKNTDSINKAHAAGKTVYIPRNKYGGSTKKRK